MTYRTIINELIRLYDSYKYMYDYTHKDEWKYKMQAIATALQYTKEI